MKKVLLVTLFLLGLGAIKIIAQNPIPSYNVAVYHTANFQEQGKKSSLMDNTRGKRVMIIKANGVPSTTATVNLYSLDGLNVLGPYIMHGGETLMVEIDSREWGVLVQSEDHITVDVWISEATKKPGNSNIFVL